MTPWNLERLWLVWLRFVSSGATCLVVLTAAAAAQQGSTKPMATFGGQPIYDNQLSAEDQTQLQKMQLQVYGVQLRALHSVVDKKLIEAEAKRRGVSVDELFKAEVVAKTAEPSQDEVKAYYQSRQVQYKEQPYDSVKDEIQRGLKNVAAKKTETVYIQGLMQQAINSGELVLAIAPPKTELSVDAKRLRGDPNAPVTIIEFSDFSCSFCKKAEATMQEVMAKYPGKVKLGYRDYPLKQLRPNAGLAAEASRCAGEQDKYWEYHDALFANVEKQERGDLIEDARKLKLDDKQFEACLSSGRYKIPVEQDLQTGSRSGVVAAPAFFIDGVFVNGGESAAVFEKAINDALSSKGK